MTPSVLALADVRFHWASRGGFSLSVPSFSVEKGERVLLLGESGSGKSTLLSLICGVILPQSGSISVNGTDLTTLSGAARDRFRAEQIGVIFQQFNLVPFGSVSDNIQLPLRFAPKRKQNAGDAHATAEALCTALGLPAQLLSAKANALSVGQQQRVAVARALIGGPPLIVADEPTSALDADSQENFLELLFDQITTSNASLLMVSHDARLADRFDRVVRIEEIAQIERVRA